MPRFYILIICCFIFSKTYPLSFSEEHFQNIKNQIKTVSNDSAIIILKKELSSKYCGSSDSAKLFNLLGNSYNIEGIQSSAIDMYKRAIDIFMLNKDHIGEIKARLNLSRTYSDVYEFTKAGNELFIAKEMSYKNKDTIYQLKTKEYFANMFFAQGLPDSTLLYLEQVVKPYEKRKDTASLLRVYNNLAVMYKRQKLFDKAINYNQKSLKLATLKNDNLGISNSYNNLGVCFENLYYQTDSIFYLKKALNYFEESSLLKLNLSEGWNTAIANLARLNRRLGNDSVADKYYEDLELTNKKMEAKDALDLYQDKMMFCLEQHDMAGAAINFVLYDSVFTEIQRLQEKDFSNMLTNQYKLHESRKKEQEQQLLLKEEQNKRLQIEQKQIITQVVFFIFIIIVLAFFYYLRQRKKYLALKAEKENKKLQDAVLRTQMNPHFIFNALTAIQNSILKEDLLVTASYVSRFARLIRQTFDFANVKSVSLEDDISALTDYIETQRMRFGDKFSYHVDIDEHLNTKNIQIPPMLLQPLVENAIQHGFKQLIRKGAITIEIKETESNKIGFAVIDNGVGYKRVDTDKKHHALDIIKKRLELFNDGDQQSFNITSNPEGGTKVYFELSLAAHV